MPTIEIHWIGLKHHLSIEAQCGTAYLPLGDCHNLHIQLPMSLLQSILVIVITFSQDEHLLL